MPYMAVARLVSVIEARLDGEQVLKFSVIGILVVFTCGLELSSYLLKMETLAHMRKILKVLRIHRTSSYA